MWNALRCGLVLAALGAAVPAQAAGPLRSGAVIALGVVGPNQYDNGKPRGVIATGFDGFWQPNKKWSIGGVGLGLRASNGIYQGLSEIGLTVPVVTHRRGRFMTQTGVMIQRLNLQKNAFYLGAGISFPDRAPKAARQP